MIFTDYLHQVKTKTIEIIYKNILKPILFKIDAEFVHDIFTTTGEFLGKYVLTRKITSLLFNYENTKLERTVLGVKFKNPIGLSAGFDYNGRLVKILPSVGFGFSTVGTVTNFPYEGNPKPRLGRLPRSKSLLVNKGFKNEGVDIIAKRLNDPFLKNVTFGVSVGSSNVPQIDTIDKAINDYIECFKKLIPNTYIKYFELNISCPNTAMPESFTNANNFEKLVIEVKKLYINIPIFVKMPNELSLEKSELLVNVAVKHDIKGFIFSNLVKDRANPSFDKHEIEKFKDFKGNFSGKPTEDNANSLVKHFRDKYSDSIAIIGCGGIFSAEDAQKKFGSGADLVQLITGMIFEGPQVIGKIVKLVK